MELDRYYQPGVAFEFNGPQHDGIETDFATAREAGMQRVRDLIKLGLCTERNLKVVTVRVEDLTLQTMQAKVGDLLPRRDLTGHEPLIALLDHIGSRAARRSRKPTDPRAPQPPGARPTPRRT
ncbi:MAG TPA: hypothetical protein VNT75_23335 [Symbiobacteriaceae bacterium]|nr:hypothetical protein [Symbiobacteriaceae bacterium]